MPDRIMKKYSLVGTVIIALLTLASFSTQPCLASSAGIIKGRVSSTDGKPLADVRVTVKDESIEAMTDQDGTFQLEDLEPDIYLLWFSHPDYQPQRLEVRIQEKLTAMVQVSLTAKNPMFLTIKEEITVTAEADSIIDISLPSHRTILPSSVLAELGTANVAESVEKVPGLAMAGKGGYSMVPSIRGLAENRILLLVDGVRISSERRIGASASFISLNDIDRIEVNRGPYSVFHGSDAVGGLINIITKSPTAFAPLQGRIQAGLNTARSELAASASIMGSQGQFGYLVGLNAKKAGDYSSPQGKIEQSRYTDYDILLKFVREVNDSQMYLTFLDYTGRDIGKPSPTSRLKPRWYPKERNTLFTLGYKAENRLHLDSLNASFYFCLPMLETEGKNLRDDLTVKSRNLAHLEGTDFGVKLRGSRSMNEVHTLNFGLDFFGRGGVRDKNMEWKLDEAGSVTSQTEETSLLEARRSNFGLYVDDKIQITPRITANVGVRVDTIRTSNVDERGHRFSRSDSAFTAYVGSVFQVNPRLSLLANIGRAFRFPTISELYYTGLTGRGTVFGNPDLSPEKSLNLDVGMRYLHEKFFASVYGFTNSISDMIQKYGGESEEYFYRNLTRGRITGLEGEFYFILTDDWELFLNFHQMAGKETTTGEPLNYVPPSRLMIWGKYSRGRFWFEPKITLTDAKTNPGPLERETEGSFLFDSILGYKLDKSLTLLLIGQNLLNRTYRFSADEDGVEAPGRGVVLKAVYTF